MLSNIIITKPSTLLDEQTCSEWCVEIIQQVSSIQNVEEQKRFVQNNRDKLLECKCALPTSLAGGGHWCGGGVNHRHCNWGFHWLCGGSSNTCDR